jgi:hypothetical protein
VKAEEDAMSALTILVGIGWPGAGLTGPPSPGTLVVSLIATVLFLLGVFELAQYGSHHRRSGPRR